MSISAHNRAAVANPGVLRSPLAALALAFVAAVILLALPIALPIGPMSSDTYVYYDGAARIFDGQIPGVDYFAPVGALGYYLFAGWLALFPSAQPTLITHYALLIVTMPLMAVILREVDAKSRATAWALLIPFLVFALLPFNGREFYPFPATDGFGIYNRQICQMLYVLVSALLYVRNQRLLAALVAICMTALFFLKITGFIAGGMICVFAFLAGRIMFRYALAAAIAFAAVLGVLELSCGLVSAYVRDIEALVATNSDTLLPRIVQSFSINIDIVTTATALGLLVLYATRERLVQRLAALRDAPSLKTLAQVLDADMFWLAAVLVAGIFFEAQNTGSQAFIFLWPILWSVLTKLPAGLSRPKLAVAIATLVAAVYMPMFVGTLERATRAYASRLNGVPVESHNLKALGNITTRDNVLHRAELTMKLYPKHQQELADYAEGKELPTPLLYSDLDYQVTNLLAADRAIDDIRALEASHGVHFQTIMHFALANPFPYLMDRSAPRLIAIGADPFRAVPAASAEVLDEVGKVDLALYPKCPMTWATVRLFEIYGPALKEHGRIALDDCYDAFVNPKFAGKLGG